ncbi:hypothetical protein [Rhodonellum sp.]|uniref:hypothetical protein n=1 Tax=Rhodonellum sp. TaxID=2231180 RepID=UPI002727FEF8|nr:hypothetical protein [Rhodonellum sp.]MDO9551684.1 hypothetical protein [Rhodonellum sp.]
MNKIEDHKTLWKQRITLMMVLLFCSLISGVEYFPQEDATASASVEVSSDPDASSDAQTFLNVAVDAVVPFVTTLSQQIFYLIYENISLASQISFEVPSSTPFTNPFLKILFERIISPNAP